MQRHFRFVQANSSLFITNILIVIAILSYWTSIAAAAVSASILSASEPLFPLSLPILALSSVMIVIFARGPHFQSDRASHDPLNMSPDPQKTAWTLAKAEWRQALPDLRWVWLMGTISFVILGIGWGVFPAGDGTSQLIPYLQLDDPDPPYFLLQIYWPPLTGLVYGGALDGFGLWFLVAVQFAQTLIAFTAVYLILLPWGRRWAWLTVGLWVTYLAHQVYFHLFGADPLTLFLNIMWILCVRWAMHYQKPGFWFLLGAAVGISILTRAGNFVLLSALLATLMLIYESRNLDGLKAVAYRCTLAAAGFALFAVPYLVYNGLRYDSFVLARAGQTVWFKSVYSTESLLEIENGPATRQFASLVEEELLVTDLYAGVTLEEFLSQPSFRTRDDSISLVDRELGWDSNYQLLRDVSFEAIRAHPAEYVRYRLRDFARMMAIKALLPGASIQSDTTEEVVFTTEAVYSTFFFNRPDGTLPDAAEVASIHEELNALLEPTTRYSGNNDIKSVVVDIWIRFGLHPVLAILVAVPYSILASPGRTRLFVIVLLVGMVGVVLPASMAAVQDRYRLTMDLVFIITVVLAALHFTRWVSRFRR